MARIKIDVSDSSVIMHCERCRCWFAFADDQADAHDRAVAHEQRVHPGETHAERAREQFRRRATRRAARP